MFGMTHYCNFVCPMCLFSDLNKENQLKFAAKHDLNTDQWKIAMAKAAKYCIWSIMEEASLLQERIFLN